MLCVSAYASAHCVKILTSCLLQSYNAWQVLCNFEQSHGWARTINSPRNYSTIHTVMERLGLLFVVSFQLYIVCIIPDNYVFIVVFVRPLPDYDSSPGIANLKSWKFKKHVGKRVMKDYLKFMDSDQVCDCLYVTDANTCVTCMCALIALVIACNTGVHIKVSER